MKPSLAIYAPKDINNEFSEYIHDHNLTIFNNGQVIKYLHFERITGKKYDNTLDQHLYEILKKSKLLTIDADLIFIDSVLGRSFLSSEGKFRFEASPWESISQEPIKARALWLIANWKNAWLVPHELAHIFSCIPFYGIFKNNSLLIHFDGGASLSNISFWLWKKNQLTLLDYSWQAKKLSSLFNANALNFFIINVKRREHNSMPGKFMGFSGFGRYDRQIEQWLIENDFFQDIWHNKKIFFQKAKEKFGWNANRFDTRDKFLQDIAATVQHYFTYQTFDIIKKWQLKTNTEYLYYTGGSALNLYTNQTLYFSKIFKDIFIPPAPGDSGLSLGAAAFIEWKKGNEIKPHLPYLNNWELENKQVIENSKDLDKIASLIYEGKVIGICNGWGEIGPRALGNRSIIALTHDRKLAQYISQKLKGREWYRPIAPIMLESEAKNITGIENIPLISRFMLMNFKILRKWQEKLMGTVHIDATARIQTLFKRQDNPFMWDLLTLLKRKYNIPALINTSFNAKGKPIVHSVDDAIKQAKEMNLEFIVIDGKLIKI